MTKLSLAMIVKNEEKNIARCLKSVKGVVDEMIVVDTGSTDNTKELASSLGAKVYDFKWVDDFSSARNFSLEKAAGDWILVLDADEYLLDECKNNLFDFIYGDKAIGRVRIISSFMQNGQMRFSRSYISRIFPKGQNFEGRVHEQIVSDLPRVNTNIEIFHDGYFETDKSDRNLKLLLKELNTRANDQYLLYQIAKQYKQLNNFEEADKYFSKAYNLLKPGDGFLGNLVVDYLYNITANKNFEKGLEIVNKESDRFKDYPDFHFVSGLFYMEMIFNNVEKYADMLPMIEREYLTCLELGDTDKYDSVLGTGSFLAAYNLGGYYEAIGDMQKAKKYYELSASCGYEMAIQRLNEFKNHENSKY